MSVVGDCDNCGKAYSKPRSNFIKHTNHYCSKECASKGHGANTLGENNPNWRNSAGRACEICGKVYKSYDKRQQFCSPDCATIANSGENCYLWKGGCSNRVPFTCVVCGKTSYAEKRVITGKNYCSLQCAGISRRGENHPNWRGGISSLYPTEFDHKTRRAVRARDGYKCRLCGATNKEHKTKYNISLDVHHVVPNRYGGSSDLSNLVSLCKTCHQTVERSFSPDEQFKMFGEAIAASV